MLLNALGHSSLEFDLDQLATGAIPTPVLVWVDGGFNGTEWVDDDTPMPFWRTNPRCAPGLPLLAQAQSIRDPSYVLFRPHGRGLEASRFDTREAAVDAMLFGGAAEEPAASSEAAVDAMLFGSAAEEPAASSEASWSSLSVRPYFVDGAAADGTSEAHDDPPDASSTTTTTLSGSTRSSSAELQQSHPGSAADHPGSAADRLGSAAGSQQQGSVGQSASPHLSEEGSGEEPEEEPEEEPGAEPDDSEPADSEPADSEPDDSEPADSEPDDSEPDDSEAPIDSDDEAETVVFPVCQTSAADLVQDADAPQVILFTAEDPPRPVRVPGVGLSASACVAGPRQSEGIEQAAWCPRRRPFVGAFFPDGTVCCVEALEDPDALRALARVIA